MIGRGLLQQRSHCSHTRLIKKSAEISTNQRANYPVVFPRFPAFLRPHTPDMQLLRGAGHWRTWGGVAEPLSLPLQALPLHSRAPGPLSHWTLRMTPSRPSLAFQGVHSIMGHTEQHQRGLGLLFQCGSRFICRRVNKIQAK